MMYRKDLVFATLAGAGLAAFGCLLITPYVAPPRLPEQETAVETKAETLQAAPDASPVVTRESQTVETSITRQPPSQAVVAPRREKTVKFARTPQVLPVSRPPRGEAAPTPPNVDGETIAAQPLPFPPNSDMSMPARTITAQEARFALSEVGANPESEAVWIAAINDPNLPAHQRKDLIEDLNEEGFADPKHLTSADLPRIEKRIALIEELAPEAIDQTNAEAFQEAYKDLKNMHSRLNKP